MKVYRVRGRAVNIAMPGTIIEDIEQTTAHVLDCSFAGKLKGLSAKEWAEMWLYKSHKRAAKILTTLSMPERGKGMVASRKAIKKDMRRNAAQKRKNTNPFIWGDNQYDS